MRKAALVGTLFYFGAYAAGLSGMVTTPSYQPELRTWSLRPVPGAINQGFYGMVGLALLVGCVAGMATRALDRREPPEDGVAGLHVAVVLAYAVLVAYVVAEQGRAWIWR